MNYKYQIGELVRIFFLSKWRIAYIIDIKEAKHDLLVKKHSYSLLICGMPDIIHHYYENQILGKL